MNRPVNTDRAPAPVGPYSQAMVNGDLVFTAGQVGIDPQTGKLLEGVKAQTRQVMDNLAAVLQASGSKWHWAVKVSIYLADINDFGEVNEIYSTYLAEPYPARSTVQVARLPLDARVEIDVMARVQG